MAMSAILAHNDQGLRQAPPNPRHGAPINPGASSTSPGGSCRRRTGAAADRRGRLLSKVLLLTAAHGSAAEILPSLSLLDHAIRIAPPLGQSVLGLPPPGGPNADRPDAVLVDARRDLVRVKELLRQIAGAGLPVLAVISEGAWAAVSAEWGVDDVILDTAGPGEVEARLRLAIGRS